MRWFHRIGDIIARRSEYWDHGPVNYFITLLVLISASGAVRGNVEASMGVAAVLATRRSRSEFIRSFSRLRLLGKPRFRIEITEQTPGEFAETMRRLVCIDTGVNRTLRRMNAYRQVLERRIRSELGAARVEVGTVGLSFDLAFTMWFTDSARAVEFVLRHGEDLVQED